jgi:DNA polymerase III delta prime subunit
MKTPFIQHYIPRRIDELLLDDELIQFIRHLFSMDNMNLLIQGGQGTGKTSIIRCILNDYISEKAVPKGVFMTDNVLWPTQTDENVQSWRECILQFCKKIPAFNCKKFVILDDIDSLNTSFQQIIRTMIEEYSHKINFICSCQNPQNVIETIQSRLYSIKLTSIKKEHIEKIFNRIAEEHGMVFTPEAKKIMLNRTADVKDMITNMEKLKLLKYPIIGELELKENLLNINHLDFARYLTLCSSFEGYKEAVKILEQYYYDGYSVNDILEEFFMYLKTLNDDDETRYKIIMCLMDSIAVFHNVHEHPIELYFFTKKVIDKLGETL